MFPADPRKSLQMWEQKKKKKPPRPVCSFPVFWFFFAFSLMFLFPACLEKRSVSPPCILLQERRGISCITLHLLFCRSTLSLYCTKMFIRVFVHCHLKAFRYSHWSTWLFPFYLCIYFCFASLLSSYLLPSRLAADQRIFDVFLLFSVLCDIHHNAGSWKWAKKQGRGGGFFSFLLSQTWSHRHCYLDALSTAAVTC